MAENPHPVDIYVGQRVRERRKLLGVTQEKLGEALGLTFQQVQKYERGTNRISSSKLYELSQFLGVPIGYFFEDMAPNSASGQKVELGRGPYEDGQPSAAEARELRAVFHRLSTRKRHAVLELMKAMAECS